MISRYNSSEFKHFYYVIEIMMKQETGMTMVFTNIMWRNTWITADSHLISDVFVCVLVRCSVFFIWFANFLSSSLLGEFTLLWPGGSIGLDDYAFYKHNTIHAGITFRWPGHRDLICGVTFFRKILALPIYLCKWSQQF